MNPNFVPNYSHRSTTFKNLFHTVTRKLLCLAGLDAERDCALLVTGSGTLANEIVISSLKGAIDVCTQGDFSSRLVNTASQYTKEAPKFSVGVQYETGESHFNEQQAFFMDCVSAFPYYELPANSRIMTTVSSKQLLSTTGLSIIFIRDYKTISDFVLPAQPTYLSLMRYIDYYDKDQTPNTPAITAISDLNTQLAIFDKIHARMSIDMYRRKLTTLLGHQNFSILGEGPVLTLNLPQNPIPSIDFYMNSGRPQAFLWSMDIAQVALIQHALSRLP